MRERTLYSTGWCFNDRMPGGCGGMGAATWEDGRDAAGRIVALCRKCEEKRLAAESRREAA